MDESLLDEEDHTVGISRPIRPISNSSIASDCSENDQRVPCRSTSSTSLCSSSSERRKSDQGDEIKELLAARLKNTAKLSVDDHFGKISI